MLSDEQNLADLDQAETSIEKRNSGQTGPTSTEGQAISARNATRHGMCATTLIMENEVEADWLDLLRTWLDGYQNPAESTLLYTFVLKTAQAEWRRLRVQSEYDFHMFGHGRPPIGAWQPHEIKNHDLILRYLMRRKPLQPAGTETMRRKPLQPAGTETMRRKPLQPAATETTSPFQNPKKQPNNPSPSRKNQGPKSSTSTTTPANQSTHKATTIRLRPTTNRNPSSPASIHPTIPPMKDQRRSDAGHLLSSC